MWSKLCDELSDYDDDSLLQLRQYWERDHERAFAMHDQKQLDEAALRIGAADVILRMRGSQLRLDV